MVHFLHANEAPLVALVFLVPLWSLAEVPSLSAAEVPWSSSVVEVPS